VAAKGAGINKAMAYNPRGDESEMAGEMQMAHGQRQEKSPAGAGLTLL